MTPTPSPSAAVRCLERIAPATLAAWRDGVLSATEAARIMAHVAECPACQAEFATYEALDTTLRSQPAPEPDERLWRAVHAVRTGERRQRRASESFGQRARRVAALVAVLLLALGFAQVLRGHAPRSTRTSATATTKPVGTPTPLPTALPAAPPTNGPQVAWQQALLPYAPLTDQDILSYGVAPSQGNAAYACHGTSDSTGATLTFYSTTDRARHWATLTQLHEPSIDLSECIVQVDALDPSRVLIEARGQDMRTFKQVAWYELSADGGATWIRLDASAGLYDLATANGKTYALRQQAPTQAGQLVLHLGVSSDHLASWQPIDAAIAGPNQVVSNFWLNPAGGLLAEVTTSTGTIESAYDTVSLWQSRDGGAHWSLFPAPTLTLSSARPRISPNFIVAQPAAGQPWHICGPYPASDGATESLACTLDGGQTWSMRSFFCPTLPCVPLVRSSLEMAVASDGAVLEEALAPGSDSQLGLYRLPQGATTWQYIGPMTGSNTFFVAPTLNGGVLWSHTGATYTARLSGIIGGHQMLPGVLTTASYP